MRMSGKAEDAGAENMQSENMRQDDMRAENAGLESGAAAKLTCGVSVAGVTAACGGSNAKPGAENARAESNAGAGEDAESAAGPAAEPDSVSGVSGRSPRLRVHGFTQPWQTRKLGELFEEYSEKNHPELPPLSVVQGGGTVLRDESDRNLQYDKSGLDRYKAVWENDFILHLRSFEGGLEKATVEGLISPAYHTFRGKGIDPRFYYLYFRSHEFVSKKLVPHIYGIRDGKSIDIEGMKSIDVPYPSVGEQRLVGRFFSGLDRIIRVQERKTEALRLSKKYFLQNMFPRRGESAPRLRVHGFTQPWQTRKLEDFGSSYGGLSGKNKDDFGHGDASFVTYKNVFLNPVADLDNVGSVEIDLSQNEVRYGDVFFTVSSEIPEEVGMSSVWVGKSENVYLNSFCFGYRPDDESVDPFFMAYMLRSDEVRRKLIFLAQGISRYNISKKAVLKIEVKLPSMEEQRLVGWFFSGLDRIIRVQERKTELLRRAKKYYLQNMFA